MGERKRYSFRSWHSERKYFYWLSESQNLEVLVHADLWQCYIIMIYFCLLTVCQNKGNTRTTQKNMTVYQYIMPMCLAHAFPMESYCFALFKITLLLGKVSSKAAMHIAFVHWLLFHWRPFLIICIKPSWGTIVIWGWSWSVD